jgi:plasmid stability protein
MTQFIVRQLEPSVKTRLKARAQRNGRSMEAEVREILRVATAETTPPAQKLGSRIAARFAGIGLATELPELRGQAAQPALFDAPAPSRKTKARKS